MGDIVTGWRKDSGKVHVAKPMSRLNIPSRTARCGQSIYGARQVAVDRRYIPADILCRTCFPGSARGATTAPNLASPDREDPAR